MITKPTKWHENAEIAFYQNDEFVEFTTVKKLAQKLNVKLDTVRFYGMPSYLSRSDTTKRRMVLLLED